MGEEAHMIPAGVAEKLTPHAHRCSHFRAAWVHASPWCAEAVEYRCPSCRLFLRSLMKHDPRRT